MMDRLSSLIADFRQEDDETTSSRAMKHFMQRTEFDFVCEFLDYPSILAVEVAYDFRQRSIAMAEELKIAS